VDHIFCGSEPAGAFVEAAIDPGSLVFLSLPAATGLLLAGMAVGSLGGFFAATGTREVAE
jgi:hypothetical protein